MRNVDHSIEVIRKKIKRITKLGNTLPLVSLTDIVMTVLLFFILTSGASQEKNDPFINVKHKTENKDKKIKSLELVIDKEGNFFYKNKKITKEELRKELLLCECNNVLMKVDRFVPIIFVVDVMNIAANLGLSTSLKEAEK